MNVESLPQEAIRARLLALRQQHRDLDDAIANLEESQAKDQLQLRRLKKMKLQLKDQISIWEDKLHPDIIA